MAVAKKTVAIIPPLMKYDKKLQVNQKTLRVAAYCRVSTLLKQQEGSYEAQVDYYTNKIADNPNWKCAGIFADDCKMRISELEKIVDLFMKFLDFMGLREKFEQFKKSISKERKEVDR